MNEVTFQRKFGCTRRDIAHFTFDVLTGRVADKDQARRVLEGCRKCDQEAWFIKGFKEALKSAANSVKTPRKVYKDYIERENERTRKRISRSIKKTG